MTRPKRKRSKHVAIRGMRGRTKEELARLIGMYESVEREIANNILHNKGNQPRLKRYIDLHNKRLTKLEKRIKG